MEWAKKCGPVFQMRLGTRVVVVANSYDTVKELWIKNSNASNSRPVLYTFHKVVSTTQGFTVGTTPYSSAYKNMKKIIATSLNKKNVDRHSDFISQECRNMFRRSEEESQLIHKLQGHQDVDLFKLLQGFVLRVSLYITYGYLVKVEHTDKCRLFDEITLVENRIVRLRGHSSNTQDYLPVLRLLGKNKKTLEANDFRRRRDVYMKKFYDGLLEKLARDEDLKSCIVSRVLRQCPELPRNITAEELNSVCLTMVSAGLDNTPLVLNHILGQLCHHPEFQELALDEIRRNYETLDVAFEKCGVKYEVDFIQALIKEGLRYFSVLPTSLPRATTKDIVYRHSVIPAGTILFMNTFAANHDTAHFDNPYYFSPMRYLDADKMTLLESNQFDHFTFGAGTRICGGAHLALKEMYVALARFMILYKIEPPDDDRFVMGLDPFEMNSEPDSVAFEPRPFKFKLIKRDKEMFDRLVMK